MAASIPFQISANESAFEKQLVTNIHHFKVFESRANQQKALERVPLEDLKAIAQAKYDSSPGASSLSAKATDVVKDMLLMELMEWFKADFFSWMNSPLCPQCNRPTHGIGSGVPTPLEMSMSAGRVEIFTCRHCFTDNREVARFPRYNNPVVLLDTRTGRCGEWANCFTLICRAAGFETRHVHDYTDHVWVEVYSFSMSPNRWVHVDPCENSYDNPLLYEIGWGKKLTYIIAVSQDDIQDVTPRYSRDFKKVLTRRNEVRESWLVSTIVRLRKGVQANLPEGRRVELKQRWVQEIIELISSKTEKDVKDAEKVGRESGSVAWRLARQELGNEMESCITSTQGFVWDIKEGSVIDGKFVLSYDGNLDTYIMKSRSGDVSINGWRKGIFSSNEIFRKEERDWKMVYLAPEEKSQAKTSNIVWKFRVDPDFSIVDIKLRMKYSIFQTDARFRVCISTQNMEMKTLFEKNVGDDVFIWNASCNSDPELQAEIGRSKTFAITCELTRGSGNEGWQKVQLFRQQLTNGKSLGELNRDIFNVECTLKKIS